MPTAVAYSDDLPAFDVDGSQDGVGQIGPYIPFAIGTLSNVEVGRKGTHVDHFFVRGGARTKLELAK